LVDIVSKYKSSRILRYINSLIIWFLSFFYANYDLFAKITGALGKLQIFFLLSLFL
jgi:hypothetical protein